MLQECAQNPHSSLLPSMRIAADRAGSPRRGIRAIVALPARRRHECGPGPLDWPTRDAYRSPSSAAAAPAPHQRRQGQRKAEPRRQQQQQSAAGWCLRQWGCDRSGSPSGCPYIACNDHGRPTWCPCRVGPDACPALRPSWPIHARARSADRHRCTHSAAAHARARRRGARARPRQPACCGGTACCRGAGSSSQLEQDVVCLTGQRRRVGLLQRTMQGIRCAPQGAAPGLCAHGRQAGGHTRSAASHICVHCAGTRARSAADHFAQPCVARSGRVSAARALRSPLALRVPLQRCSPAWRTKDASTGV